MALAGKSRDIVNPPADLLKALAGSRAIRMSGLAVAFLLKAFQETEKLTENRCTINKVHRSADKKP